MGRLDNCFKCVKNYYVEVVPKKRIKIMGLNYMGVGFSQTSGKTFNWQELCNKTSFGDGRVFVAEKL